MKLPQDHIYVILIAFLAALACFTAVSIAGVDAAVSTMRDVLSVLVGALATAYVGRKNGNGV